MSMDFLGAFLSTESIGGSRGGREGRTPPPGRPNSFDFMQFSGKFGVFTPPPGGFTPPPRENPGSATGKVIMFEC